MNFISITLFGFINNTSNVLWENWFNYSKVLSKNIGYEMNYLGVEGDIIKSKKLTKIKTMDNKLSNVFDKKSRIEYISLYSLPEDFETAAFDYYLHSIRDILDGQLGHVTITMREHIFKNLHDEQILEIINQLKGFVQFEEGIVFQTDIDDDPLSYIMDREYNIPESLVILKKF